MKTDRRQSNDRFFVIAVISFVAILATGTAAYGQKTAPQRDMSGAERNVRAMEIGAGGSKDSKTILAEINEDFERLRTMNEEVKTAASSTVPLDYKAISNNSVEIRKRVTRLKANLAGLPKAENEEKRRKKNIPLDDGQMKLLLSSLNEVITSFLSNPVFSDMGTLDNQLALKARRDLEDLIELSDVVKKGAEKLGKGAGR